MMLDCIVVAVTLASFLFFAAAHVLFFRYGPPVHIMPHLTRNFVVGAAIEAGLWTALLTAGVCRNSAPELVVVGILASFFIYGTLAFSYVICLVGPYETSIRVRLVRELDNASDGLTLPELKERYSHERLLQIRLKRLELSGDLANEAGAYRAVRRGSVLTFITSITRILKRCYGL